MRFPSLTSILVLVLAAVVVPLLRPKAAYNSVVTQSLHYFSRPTAGDIATAPISSPAAWYGIDLASKSDLWRTELTVNMKQSLIEAVQNLPSDDIGELAPNVIKWSEDVLQVGNKTTEQ